MGRILNVTQIQTLCINRQKQMRNGTMPRQSPHFVPPLRQSLRFTLRRRHQLDCIKRSSIRNHRLLRLDDTSILQTHAHGPSIFDEDLIDMCIQLEFSAKFLKAALECISQFARSPDRNRESCRLLEESFEDVQQMGGHGAFGGETAEDAHGIYKVFQKWDRDVFLRCFGKVIERQRKVSKDIGMGEYERQRTSGGRKETNILTEIQQCHGRGTSSQCLQPVPQRSPLLNGFGAILATLVH
mmetsp:Transcript_24042/g.43136  ORF Transcript_24042/g.43136 Transcript_24042/m.43136 type:complete len:241 (-) Transcript_24042:787-1509(-)